MVVTVMDYRFDVEWDHDAQVWWVAESDVPGLCTEAETLDSLTERLMVLIPELVEQ